MLRNVDLSTVYRGPTITNGEILKFIFWTQYYSPLKGPQQNPLATADVKSVESLMDVL